jgi:membrane-bound ClpP family serine protease
VQLRFAGSRADTACMDSNKRRLNLIALPLLTVGLVALFVTYVSQGWTTLGIIGCAGLAVAVVATAIQLRTPSRG